MTTINLQKGLEALYYFDEKYLDQNDDSIGDHSGKGRRAEASGGPTVGVPGPNDFQAASFDGIDDVIKLSDSTGMPSSDNEPVTFAVRIKTYADDGANEYFFSSQGSGGFQNNTYSLVFDANIFGITGGDNDDYTRLRGEYNTEEWFDFVGIYDGEEFRIYFDGVFIDRTDVDVTLQDGNPDYTIKSENHSYDLAYACVWSRAISYEEIQTLNRMTAPRRAQI